MSVGNSKRWCHSVTATIDTTTTLNCDDMDASGLSRWQANWFAADMREGKQAKAQLSAPVMMAQALPKDVLSDAPSAITPSPAKAVARSPVGGAKVIQFPGGASAAVKAGAVAAEAAAPEVVTATATVAARASTILQLWPAASAIGLLLSPVFDAAPQLYVVQVSGHDLSGEYAIRAGADGKVGTLTLNRGLRDPVLRSWPEIKSKIKEDLEYGEPKPAPLMTFDVRPGGPGEGRLVVVNDKDVPIGTVDPEGYEVTFTDPGKLAELKEFALPGRALTDEEKQRLYPLLAAYGVPTSTLMQSKWMATDPDPPQTRLSASGDEADKGPKLIPGFIHTKEQAERYFDLKTTRPDLDDAAIKRIIENESETLAAAGQTGTVYRRESESPQANIANLMWGSGSGLEFVRGLSEGPLRAEFAALTGTPVKNYPLQRQPDGSTAVTISQALLGQQHPEFDRTGLGEAQLHALMNDNRELFPDISEENFFLLQQCIYESVKKDGAPDTFRSPGSIPREYVNAERLEALVVLLGIHDLAKIREVDNAMRGEGDRYASTQDHDEVAWHVLTSGDQSLIAKYFPSFARLNDMQRSMVLGGLASSINPGRIYQLEGTAGEFALGLRHGAVDISPAIYRAFHVLDIGSIRGNAYVVDGEPLKNANGKRADVFWNNFTLSFMPPIFDLAGQVAAGRISPVQAYANFLARRAAEFGLDPSTPSGYAATRISAMINTRFPEVRPMDVLRFLNDQEGPENMWKWELVAELSRTGYDGSPSIALGYMPDVAAKIAAGMRAENPGVSFSDMLLVFSRSLYNSFRASRAAINDDPELRSKAGQVTVELEKLHPQLAGGNHRRLEQYLPPLRRAGDGFVMDTLPSGQEL
jgi:hypothetical protein